jgi:hypothetical protein
VIAGSGLYRGEDMPEQLNLSDTLSQVPQANNLSLLIALIDAMSKGTSTLDALAEYLGVEIRTVQYYLEFAHWLGFLRFTGSTETELTSRGRSFHSSESARARLFCESMESQAIVKKVHSIRVAEIEAGRPIDLRRACYQAISEMTKLSETTARRRASSLAQMIEAALSSDAVDWSTGNWLPRMERLAFDVEGRTFLTAVDLVKFGVKKPSYIALPRQNELFVGCRFADFDRTLFQRACIESDDRTWYGFIPSTVSTCELAHAGGRSLRRLVVTCSPYAALLIGILSDPGVNANTACRITHDMYGVRVWIGHRLVGAARTVLDRVGRAVGFEPATELPAELKGQPVEVVGDLDDAGLFALLYEIGLLVREDTRARVPPRVLAELRDVGGPSPPLQERLRPIHKVWQRALAGESG